jgi:hypothetical protein
VARKRTSKAPRRKAFTVAILPTGARLSAKGRWKSLVATLGLEEGRKPPLRADRTPVETLRVWKRPSSGR